MLNSEFSLGVALQMPFSHKANIVLTRLLKFNNFQQCIRKTITIAPSDRPIFQEVLTQLRECLAEGRAEGSAVAVRGASIEVEEREETLSYDIVRSFIKCNTLREFLLQEKPQICASAGVVQALLGAYLHSAHLNHIVCSASNIFPNHKSWNKHTSFEFNFTSLGFLFDTYRSRPLCQADLVEYVNYLPVDFYSRPVKSRFGFQLKVRSLAVNLLSIVLQRDINFLRRMGSAAEYPEARITEILVKVHSFFQELLEDEGIQWQIEAASRAVGVDLLTFFRVVICRPKGSEFQQFNSWTKVIAYFKSPLLLPYQKVFQAERQPGKTSSLPSAVAYLEGWVGRMWSSENEYIRKRFTELGIVGQADRDDLILYLLYRHKLINEPQFDDHRPAFLKLIIKTYAQIIDSDFLLEEVKPRQIEWAKLKRDERILEAVSGLSGQLRDFSTRVNGKQQLLFVAKEGLDIRGVYDRCWHFRAP